MKILTDFYSDYSEIVRANLESIGYTDLPTDLMSLLHIYYNYQLRIVHPTPRKIEKPIGFQCPVALQDALEKLENKIRNGDDINSHLSKNIKKYDYDDSLLNDWGIHHLHLGTYVDSEGFVNRTGSVLFVRFTDSTAYFIVINIHGTWSDLNMMEVLHRNWPDTLGPYRIRGVVGLEHSPNSDEIKKLRKANAVSILDVDGSFYIPIGGGCMTSGISMDVVMITDKVLLKIKNMEENFKSNSNKIRKLIKNRYGKQEFARFKFIVVKNSRQAYAMSEAFRLKIHIGEL